MLVKKVTNLWEFGYLNSSCIRKSITPPAWRRHKNLYKFGWGISRHILLRRNSCDLALGASLYIFNGLLSFSRLWTLSIERFWFLVEWRDTENQQFLSIFRAYFRLHCADRSELGIIEKIFPPAELSEHRWCQFWWKVMTSEVEQKMGRGSYGRLQAGRESIC